METILIIDDEADMLELLEISLHKSGYKSAHALDGQTGLKMLEEQLPDLVIFDVSLPDVSGLELLEQIRADVRWRWVPVLILSARGEIQDRIDGLSRGADDYMGKPFSVKELLLRVASLLRRSSAERSFVRVGSLLVDRNALRCYLRGKLLDLTTTEYKILTLLLENKGEILSRNRILRHVWGRQEEAASRSLDTHMRRLRNKLGKYGDLIGTIRNRGYRFVSPNG
ncbi:MAG: response regulator transcription factor [Verrucomicrobiales bacterium]|nr:response regulator transcription factor [Verrucomicrobiales bacterium]